MKAENRDIYKDKVEISVTSLIEIKRAFRALARDKESYFNKVFSDDMCFDAIQELRIAYNDYFEETKSFTI